MVQSRLGGGHVPIGIWYLIEIIGLDTAHWWDWPLAILYIAAFMSIVMQLIGFRILADPNSPYPFTPEEMNRKGQLHRAGITPRTGFIPGPGGQET